VAVQENKKTFTGAVQANMVEFMATSSIYQPKLTEASVRGHVYQLGDLTIKMGTLTLNYPKMLLV